MALNNFKTPVIYIEKITIDRNMCSPEFKTKLRPPISI